MPGARGAAARPFAWRDGRAIPRADFLREVATLAAHWPRGARVLNVCEDRYAFLVGFAAALTSGGTTLLPHSRAAAVLAEVRDANPGSLLCDDATVAALAHGAVVPGRAALAWPLAIDPDHRVAIGYTSGSTGLPAAHDKSWAGLVGPCACNAARLREVFAPDARGAEPALVATVPPQHMYGIETTVLLPLAAGMSVHAGRPFYPLDVVAALASVPAPRVLVTTPVHLRALVAAGERWPALAAILCATAPLDAELAAQAEAVLGAPLLEMYGATETCVTATRRTARDDAWTPHAGVRFEPRVDGLRVHAPWLREPVELADRAEVGADGRFVLRGRSADLIEVAGKRASLADLTRRLRQVPGVVDAVIVQPDAVPGHARRVAALVVAPGLDAAAIRARLAGAIDPAFVPRPLLVVDELPRNEVGKLPRDAVLARIARGPG